MNQTEISNKQLDELSNDELSQILEKLDEPTEWQ
jgi:hypothetical protein